MAARAFVLRLGRNLDGELRRTLRAGAARGCGANAAGRFRRVRIRKRAVGRDRESRKACCLGRALPAPVVSPVRRTVSAPQAPYRALTCIRRAPDWSL